MAKSGFMKNAPDLHI